MNVRLIVMAGQTLLRRPYLVPVKARITVHSRDAEYVSVAPEGGDRLTYIDSTNKLALGVVRLGWVVVIGASSRKAAEAAVRKACGQSSIGPCTDGCFFAFGATQRVATRPPLVGDHIIEATLQL